MKRTQQGFTLIELLVVIAIIGLLSTLAVVALNSARQRSRDAKRVADVRQIQTALELGFSEANEYPDTAGADVVLGTDAAQLCSDGSATPLMLWVTSAGAPVLNMAADGSGACGGTTYMGLVPSNPTPGGAAYTYASDGDTYSLTFTLEGATGQLGVGANCANADGIVAGTSC